MMGPPPEFFQWAYYQWYMMNGWGQGWSNFTNSANFTNGSNSTNSTNGTWYIPNGYLLDGFNTTDNNFSSFADYALQTTSQDGNLTSFGATPESSLIFLYNQTVFGIANETLLSKNGTDQKQTQADCDAVFRDFMDFWGAISDDLWQLRPDLTQNQILDGLLRARRMHLCQTAVVSYGVQFVCLGNGLLQFRDDTAALFKALAANDLPALAEAAEVIPDNVIGFRNCAK